MAFEALPRRHSEVAGTARAEESAARGNTTASGFAQGDVQCSSNPNYYDMVCVYVCMYVCLYVSYVSVCVSMCLYVSLCVSMCLYVSACVCICLYMSVNVCMSVCL